MNCVYSYSKVLSAVLRSFGFIPLFFSYQGEREDLLTVADQVLKALHQLGNFEDSDFTVKKLTVKIVQRLGMVFLKPKVSKYLYLLNLQYFIFFFGLYGELFTIFVFEIAKWRYDNGNRNLDFKSSDFLKYREFNTLEVESFAEEDYEVPYAEVITSKTKFYFRRFAVIMRENNIIQMGKKYVSCGRC